MIQVTKQTSSPTPPRSISHFTLSSHRSITHKAIPRPFPTSTGQSDYDVALRTVGLPGTLLIPSADLDLCANECRLASSLSFLRNIEPGLADALLVRRDRIDQARSDGVCDRPGVWPASCVRL